MATGATETRPLLYSADETTDLGDDTGTPVTDDYSQSEFSGKIRTTTAHPAVENNAVMTTAIQSQNAACARR